jgi:glycerate 2-kinase
MTLGEARELVRTAFLETLPALQVGPRLRQRVRLDGRTLHVAGDRYQLSEGRPVRVISIGKAAVPMAHTLAEILAGIRLRGVVAAPELPPSPLEGFEYFAAGHPYPNKQSWKAAEAALALLQRKNVDAHGDAELDATLDEQDLVLFLISGGGSALFELPLASSLTFEGRTFSVDEMRRFNEVLVTCGGTIEEINVIRKHFSAVKGGRLALAASPARQITLYVSDVPESMPSMVASGPTMPDESTIGDCRQLLTRYGILNKLPEIFSELSLCLPETPKPGDPCFANSRYYPLLSNADAVSAFAQHLRSHGVLVDVENICDGWEYRRAADHMLAQLAHLHSGDPGRPAAVVSGGEVSCAVPGDGIGGRNQAFALYCATKIAGKRIVALSAGTDGIDGNSPAAGALADGTSTGRAAALKLSPEAFLDRSDSYSFFHQLGDALRTGPTGTNVRDLRVALAYG